MTERRIWAPRPGMTRAPSPDIADEVDALVRILREQGPLDAPSLRRLAETRYWGPGTFSAALGRAREQGRVRRTGWRTNDSGR
jgi:hypothetical protein